ncbi:MAG TPA: PA14 domain-containing protein [Anaerolineae bacterium]|nr:PA14 domain-containing protein [Anaerolineae bacterium]
MPAPSGNPYIFGLHYWSGAADLFNLQDPDPAKRRPGWVVEFGYTHDFPRLTVWGASPPQADTGSVVVQGIQQASDNGLTVIVRIDGKGGKPIIKMGDPDYAEFKERLIHAVWVLRVPPYNVKRFIIGNEPNIATDPVITPAEYADVYNDIRSTMHAQHPDWTDVELLVAAVAPWAPRNGAGPYVAPWKNYFHEMLDRIPVADGLAIHAYGRVGDQELSPLCDEPRADTEAGFQVYKWWMKEISTYWSPQYHATKPVYLTELNTAGVGSATPNPAPVCDSNSPAQNYSSYWINRAFEDIDLWNRYHSNRLQCACWFVGQAGRNWDCFALEAGNGRLPTARSNWVAMVSSANYRNDYQSPLGLVYDLDTAQSDLNSSDPNRIVLGLYRGTCTWNGAYMDMGSGGPLGPAGPVDNFVILHFQRFWAGQEGWYNFATTSDDGSWLWIDGQIVVDNHGLHGAQRVTGSKYLKAGIHIAAFKMFEYGGGAVAGYEYQPPNGVWQALPHDVYSGTSHAWGLDVGASDLGSPEWTLIKPSFWIYDFRWEGGYSPAWSGGPDNQPDDFIVEHARYFHAPWDGVYSFRIASDDGSWLWIDGAIVANNYGLHGEQTVIGAVFLRAGWHLLHFKMFERTGGAALLLDWKPPVMASYSVIGTYADPAWLGKPRSEW